MAEGVTSRDVPLTVPMPSSIVRVVACFVDQDNVLLPPGAMEAGVAVKLEMIGIGMGVTETVVVAVVLPEELVAVRV